MVPRAERDPERRLLVVGRRRRRSESGEPVEDRQRLGNVGVAGRPGIALEQAGDSGEVGVERNRKLVADRVLSRLEARRSG